MEKKALLNAAVGNISRAAMLDYKSIVIIERPMLDPVNFMWAKAIPCVIEEQLLY